MTVIAPQLMRWDAERSVMVPLRPRLADKVYVDQETYSLAPVEERSEASHRAYFASLNEAHKNLSDELVERFPTVKKLRKYALIRCGYFNSRSIVCPSPEVARKVAAFVAQMDEFAVVTVEEEVVTVYTAKSQSYRAMDRVTFNNSKQAVLDFISAMIGLTAEELQKNSGRAA